MTKRTFAVILIAVILLSAVLSAGGVLFAPKSLFEQFDADRETSLEEALGNTADIKSEPLSPMSDSERYIVKFKDEVALTEIESALKNIEFRLLAESEQRLVSVALENSDFLNKYTTIIDYFEPDFIRDTLAITDDAVTMPSYESLGIYSAWDIAVGTNDVIVAVLDTGVERSHEDLVDVNILNGYDAVGRTSGVNEDTAGHGTGVIGIIAAAANNQKGIAGVAHGVSILPVKVSSSSTAIYSSDLISGIRFAADAGAKIINMSVGGYSSSYAEQEAVNYAVSKGCILISAAGNGGNRPYADQKSYPASYDGVISVASCNQDGERSEFSQYNDSVDVAAIGEAITMPYVEDGTSIYRADSGTSYSCAIVSGIAALAASYIDDGVRFGGDEFLSLIADTCGQERSIEFGHGIINAYDIINITNSPIITGVYNGATYSESVYIGFNRGTARLNGAPFSDGDAIIKNGKHTLTVTDRDIVKTVTFTLDYNPLSYKFKEFSAFSYFSFERGTALLDGFPYESEEHIVASGRHEFVLFEGEEILKKEIYLQYSLPTVYGIEDGKIYTEPVNIRVIGDGVAELDGEKIYGDATVAENGKHTLTVTSGNGAVTKKYSFEIKFPYGQFIDNDYAMASAAVDEDNGYICLYGESLVGVRIYDIASPENFTHFLPVGRVYEHAFTENELLLFGDNGVTVITRKNALDTETAVDRVISPENMDHFCFGDGTVYCFDGDSMFSLDITMGETTLVAELGIDCETAFYSEGTFYLISNGTLYSYDLDDSVLTELFDIDAENANVCFGNGYIAVGNRLVDVSNNETTLEFAATEAVKIENGLLFTDRCIIDILSGEEIGSFPFTVSDIVFGDDAVYLFGAEKKCAIIKNGADGVAVYGAARCLDNAFSPTETVNGYRKVLFYDRYTAPISSASGDENLFVLFDGKNALYSITLDDLSENEPLALRFEPKAVYTSGEYVAVSFKNMPYVYLATENDIENGRYILLPDICDSAFILNRRLYSATGGKLVYCPINGGAVTKTRVLADNAVLSDETIYCLSGNELSAYTSTLTNIATITVQSGDLAVGNGVAVGNTIYNAALKDDVVRLNSKILDFKGNTVVTKSGVYDLNATEYIGNMGVKSAVISTITSNNSIIAFGAGLISVCSFGDGSEITSNANITGITEGSIYLDSVRIEYEHGIGYLDGKPFKSGDTATDAGVHIFKVALPCGRNISVNFTIESNIEKIEFLVGERVMSVGETVTLGVRYLPDGASSMPFTLSCDSDGLLIGEMGEITALEVGKYTVTANVKTDYGSFSAQCTITVRDDLIVFAEDSGLSIDRDNGFIIGVEAGTTVSALIEKLNSSGDAFVLDANENNVTEYVGTNDRLVLQNDEGITDSLIVIVAGDTDGDGFITAYDLYVLECILRGESYENAFLFAADVNRNGITDDNDYRDLKNNLLYIIEANLGTPNKNLFGLSTIQTVSRVESGSIIDVTVCISGCKYTRAVSGVINFSDGLEFIEGVSTGWQTDYRNFDNRVSFYAFGADGKECEKAFKLLINLRFRVTAEAGNTVTFSSDGLTVASDAESSIIRFDTTELFVYEPQTGDFKIDFHNAYDFKFDENKREYDVVIPYNNALADISVTRNEGQTVSVSNPVIPDSGSGTVTVTLTEANGISKVYTIHVTRDKEPRFDTNCRLSTLEIEGFRLAPQFSPDILSYNLTVPYGTEKINVYCTAQNPTASVIVGDTTITGEETTVTVTVGAPDGETLKYVIHVFMLPPEEESSQDSTSNEEPNDNTHSFTLYAIIIAVVAAAIVVTLYVKIGKHDEAIKREEENENHNDNTEQ